MTKQRDVRPELLELERHVSSRWPEQVLLARRGLWVVHIYPQQWLALIESGSQNAASKKKAWERWKRRVRDLGLEAKPHESLQPPVFAFLVEALGQPAQHEDIETRFERVADRSYKPKGISRRKAGLAGMSGHPIPAFQAAIRLEEIRDYLGLTQARMAELLGLTTNAYAKMICNGRLGRNKTADSDLLERAEELLDEVVIQPKWSSTRLQRITPEILHAALVACDWKVQPATALLGYKSDDPIKKLAIEYGFGPMLRKKSHVASRISKDEIRAAMRDASWSITRCAKRMGISASTLRRAIVAHGMQAELKPHMRYYSGKKRSSSWLDG